MTDFLLERERTSRSQAHPHLVEERGRWWSSRQQELREKESLIHLKCGGRWLEKSGGLSISSYEVRRGGDEGSRKRLWDSRQGERKAPPAHAKRTIERLMGERIAHSLRSHGLHKIRLRKAKKVRRGWGVMPHKDACWRGKEGSGKSCNQSGRPRLEKERNSSLTIYEE